MIDDDIFDTSFQPRNAAEREFVKCMKAGRQCILGTSRPEPKIDDGQKNVLGIRAKMIRYFVLSGETPGNIIHLQGAWVPDFLDLAHADIPCTLRFINCYFCAPVTMAYSACRFVNLRDSHFSKHLSMDNLKVNHDVFMNDKFLAEDGVYMAGADIGGDLNCHGGTFKNEDGAALVVIQAKIRGNLVMSDGFSAEGGVFLSDASIGDNMYCNKAHFKNQYPHQAIFAEGLAVKNHVYMGDGFSADGEVRLVGATIGGLYCDGARFNNKEAVSINADRIKVTHDISMQTGFVAEGMVRLPQADIGNILYCQNSQFNGGLDLQSVKIKSSLLLKGITGHGKIDLSFASVGVLSDDKTPQSAFKFDLDGFSYLQFANHADVQSRIDWLNNRAEGVDFSPQPFEQAANVMFAMARDDDARAILLEKERLHTKQKKWFSPRKWLRLLWGGLAGYGYRLWLTVLWTILVIVGGAYFFDYADKSCRMFPHQPAVVAQYTQAQKDGECSDDTRPTRVVAEKFPAYPRFHALAYSADVFFPFFALHQESHWYPRPPETGTDSFLVWWYWFEIIAGWILTSLFVLSATGLLRPRQSSGGKE